MEELIRVMHLLGNNKTPGLDQVVNEYLKHVNAETLEWLLKEYNKLWAKGQTPTRFDVSYLVAIYKSKAATKPENYRLISPTSPCKCVAQSVRSSDQEQAFRPHSGRSAGAPVRVPAG